MERVITTKPVQGLCHMQVCAVADATDEEILSHCNRDNPSGTSNGWCSVVRDDKEHPQANPVVCSEHPDRRHFLVAC